MSRIPVPSRSNEERSQSPTPYPLQPSQQSNLARSTSSFDMSSTSSYRNSPLASDATDTRKRQSKRDEAIRKKIENELQRKAGKPTTPATRRRKPARPAAQAGTVSALRPLPALTVPQSISVADASQLCAAKRTDCVLVVDEEEHLAGIFTAKDLAFRVSVLGSVLCCPPVFVPSSDHRFIHSFILYRSFPLDWMPVTRLSAQS